MPADNNNSSFDLDKIYKAQFLILNFLAKFQFELSGEQGFNVTIVPDAQLNESFSKLLLEINQKENDLIGKSLKENSDEYSNFTASRKDTILEPLYAASGENSALSFLKAIRNSEKEDCRTTVQAWQIVILDHHGGLISDRDKPFMSEKDFSSLDKLNFNQAINLKFKEKFSNLYDFYSEIGELYTCIDTFVQQNFVSFQANRSVIPENQEFLKNKIFLKIKAIASTAIPEQDAKALQKNVFLNELQKLLPNPSNELAKTTFKNSNTFAGGISLVKQTIKDAAASVKSFFLKSASYLLAVPLTIIDSLAKDDNKPNQAEPSINSIAASYEEIAMPRAKESKESSLDTIFSGLIIDINPFSTALHKNAQSIYKFFRPVAPEKSSKTTQEASSTFTPKK